MPVITLDKLGAELRTLLEQASKKQKREIGKLAQRFPYNAERAAVAFYPKVLKRRSGELVGSIHGFAEPKGDDLWIMGLESDKKYAAAQEYGAYIPPHGISAKPKRMATDGQPGRLQFEVGGQILYRYRVHHPGGYIKPKRFLRTPLRKCAERLVEDIRKVVALR